MMDSFGRMLALVLVVAAIGAAAWWYVQSRAPVPEPVIAPAAEPAAPEPVQMGPLHPLPALSPEQATDREWVPLPALDDSDGYFLLALIDTFGRDVEGVLVQQELIDKFVATVDNLTRKHVAEKIRPVNQLAGAFDTLEDGDSYYLSPENFSRYDILIGIIAGADPESIIDTYRRFYPLLQESYVRLGYPGRYFNDRVVEVIDHLLATPVVDQPIQLVRPHVLYEFADPELQALSSGQKLLLRMGPAHMATLQQVLRQLRERIATD